MIKFLFILFALMAMNNSVQACTIMSDSQWNLLHENLKSGTPEVIKDVEERIKTLKADKTACFEALGGRERLNFLRAEMAKLSEFTWPLTDQLGKNRLEEDPNKVVIQASNGMPETIYIDSFSFSFENLPITIEFARMLSPSIFAITNKFRKLKSENNYLVDAQFIDSSFQIKWLTACQELSQRTAFDSDASKTIEDIGTFLVCPMKSGAFDKNAIRTRLSEAKSVNAQLALSYEQLHKRLDLIYKQMAILQPRIQMLAILQDNLENISMKLDEFHLVQTKGYEAGEDEFMQKYSAENLTWHEIQSPYSELNSTALQLHFLEVIGGFQLMKNLMARAWTAVVFMVTLFMIAGYQNCGSQNSQIYNGTQNLTNNASVNVMGTVQQSSIDGCNKIIAAVDNDTGMIQNFIPQNMDPSLLVKGNVVKVSGTLVTDEVNDCMVGPVLKVEEASLVSN